MSILMDLDWILPIYCTMYYVGKRGCSTPYVILPSGKYRKNKYITSYLN